MAEPVLHADGPVRRLGLDLSGRYNFRAGHSACDPLSGDLLYAVTMTPRQISVTSEASYITRSSGRCGLQVRDSCRKRWTDDTEIRNMAPECGPYNRATP